MSISNKTAAQRVSSRTALVGFGVAAGVVAGLCWLPLGLAPALPLAFVLAMLGLARAETMRDAFRFGLAFGAVRYTVAAHFLLALLAYSPLAVVFYVLAIVFALPFALFEAMGAFWLERRTGLPRSFAFAVLYTLGEWLRTLGDLSFPADMLAHAYGTAPGFLAWTSVAGPHLVTLSIGVIAATLVWAWSLRAEPRRALVPAAAALALWAGPWVFSLGGTTEGDAAATMRVGLVQPAATVEEKLLRENHARVWARLERLSEQAAQGADLVIWPESARPTPVVWEEGTPFADPEMTALAERLGVPILYGTEIARVSQRRLVALYNGAAIAHPDRTTPPQWYGKQRLLPFAEGVPFAKLLGWDKSKRTGGRKKGYLTLLGNFSPGPEPTIFEVGGARLGVLICYEGMYPRLARRYRQEGANALVAITNDAWWGKSLFASWHARMMASRARENDIPVVRAANSGISSISDHTGRLLASTALDEITHLQVSLTPTSTAPTVYARFGDVLVWMLVFSLVVLVSVSLALRRPLIAGRETLGTLTRFDPTRARARGRREEDAA